MRELGRDEGGLIGKLIVLWLVVAAIFVVSVLDAGSIILSRVRTADVAQDASFAAAEAFARGGRRAAVAAALTVIEDSGRGARLKELEIASDGSVTVVLTARAGTLLAGRLWFTKDLTRLTVRDTSPAPGG